MSSWEITIKVRAGRLDLPERPAEFVTRAMQIMSLQALDITHLHALALDAFTSGVWRNLNSAQPIAVVQVYLERGSPSIVR